jgi:broad specificity phosphatase PhoE
LHQGPPAYAAPVPTILLIRHGQASFGAADYDVLSPKGREQSDVLAGELAGRRLNVARIVSGSLRRQIETAEPAAAAFGQPVTVDPGWNEYDMDDILANHSSTWARVSRPGDGEQPSLSSEDFQRLLDDALASWIAAGSTGPAAETWPGFGDRVRASLGTASAGLPSGSTALVFTSGGVIAAVCAALMQLPEPTLISFNRVCVNTAITKLVSGRRGITLVSFNEHTYLERRGPSLVTYR